MVDKPLDQRSTENSNQELIDALLSQADPNPPELVHWYQALVKDFLAQVFSFNSIHAIIEIPRISVNSKAVEEFHISLQDPDNSLYEGCDLLLILQPMNTKDFLYYHDFPFGRSAEVRTDFKALVWENKTIDGKIVRTLFNPIPNSDLSDIIPEGIRTETINSEDMLREIWRKNSADIVF
jgi:hypothetical protein